MGIHDRDYYRDDSDGLFAAWGRWGTTVWLIVVTAAVFLGQLATLDPRDPRLTGLTRWGVYDYHRILTEGQVWRLLTPVFLHDPYPGGWLHIVFNMFLLYWVGKILETIYGGREFLAFYLAAGVFGYAGNLAANALDVAPMVPALGASGAVTAAFVLFALHFPKQEVRLFFVIPMPIWLVVVGYVVLDSLGAVGLRGGRTAYVVHLAGALFGYLYFQGQWRLTGSRSARWSRPAAERRERPQLRVLPADEDDADDGPPDPPDRSPEPAEQLETKLDRVLEKVSKHGQAGLTAEEREILFRASEIYKNRRK